MTEYVFVVDNVMFLMFNKDKNFEIGTSQTTKQTERHKRRHLKQKKKTTCHGKYCYIYLLGVPSTAI